MQIKFFFEGVSIKIPERKKLKQFIADLFKKEGRPLASLTYIFCTDSYLLSINREFLEHDDYTDIISFTLSGVADPVIGEIYISLERVKENAAKYEVGTMTELYRVVFHGALHLCGYRDKTAAEKKKMRSAENKYLNLFL